MNAAALFDFDKTIINKDTGFCFILYSLKRNYLRTILAILLTPLILPLFTSNRTRYLGNSVYLWISTFGLSPVRIEKLRQAFIDTFLSIDEVVIYQEALSRIDMHQIENERVVIISGSSQWMLEKIFKKIGYSGLTLIGSNETRFLGGMVSKFHCFAQNKLVQLERKLTIKDFNSITGYTDSSNDVPLLSLCSQKYLVNPNKRCLKRFQKSFGQDAKVLIWS
ncbi:HAD-IB family phosphatase [Aliikangiella sp. G2MR2-5]|uniref:HAD-IB family phosphatase n=1 Tax=Aliikangiella sp. G2MR2-5 TaxID=2788943 RepID=UPI0018AC7416|nr:HAD-IB family phosphatase [Aliikangiella sp. G2MR2-5]